MSAPPASSHAAAPNESAAVVGYAPPAFEHKILSPQPFGATLAQPALADLTAWAARLPRPLVFTNGCFDLLHRGHVTYLAQARALGARLLVAVNSDASVKRLGKGEARPLNPQLQRMAVLAALESVDHVAAFDDDTPLALILALRPDILVKGGDWLPEQIVGAREVRSWDGSVHAIPFLHDTSTTALVRQIQSGSR